MLQSRCETILFSLETVFNCREQPSNIPKKRAKRGKKREEGQDAAEQV